jgi:hypothetical protein
LNLALVALSTPWPGGGSFDSTAREPFIQRLALSLVWLCFALSGIVFAEPAPVDLILILLIGLLPLAGLAEMNRTLLIYLMLWLLVVAGGCLGAMDSFDLAVGSKQVAITFYLSLSSVILAGFIEANPARHMALIMNGYVMASVVATLAALIGYFDLVPPLTNTFTLYGRARGTFKDPNVYGAFVVPALVYAVYLAFNSRPRTAFVALGVTGFLLLGSLLSFSRGAWINAGMSLAIFCYLSFVTSASNRFRVRIIGLLSLAAVLGTIVLGFALQSPKVSALLSERAQLTQSYDSEPYGRFAGHAKAKALIASRPFGIGPLQFGGNYHHEDVHQVYLNMLVGHGWLGGGAYIVLVILTLLIGIAGAFVPGPAQGLMLVMVSAYAGTVMEGFVVDTDHWRHFFVLMAAIWGLFLGSRPKRSIDA